MASQFSHIEGTLNIYFVVLSKYESAEQCSDDMWEAFNKCQENELEPTWICEKECYNLSPTKTDIFVIEEFQGMLFEKLQNFKCLIIGPLCLLRCFLTGEPVPSGTSPVFTTAMRDMVVCASGFCQKTKEEIRQKVEYMGGIFIKELRGCITHLVTDSVLSKKYERAAEVGISIYTDEWVHKVWEMNLTSFIKATEPIFDQYKCPIFLNLVVTTTNLGKRQKEEVRKFITENGGTYMGDLDGSKVKLVIAKEYISSSAKLKFAFQNNIPCVKIEWLFKCIDVGYSLPIADYIITPSSKAMSSTPERGSMHQITLNCSNVSTIPCETNRNYVEETMSSTVSSNIESRQRDFVPSFSVVDKLDIKEAKKAGPFLDGCNIYLAGFVPQHRDKISRILNVGSATRFDDISDSLTHVLVGDPNKANNELKLIQSKGINPHILTVNWLEKSMKLKKPAPEDDFILPRKENINTQITEPASPLSKKSLQLLKSKKPPVPKFNIDQIPPADNINDNDEPDIVQQYLNKTSDRTALEVNRSLNIENNATTLVNQRPSLNDGPDNVSSIPLSQSCSVTEQIFKKLKFFVTGFNEEESCIVITSISGLGGKLVSNSFSGIPDFGVVPITGAKLKHTVNEIVTNLFIDHCIDSDKLVDIEYYHRPILVPEGVNPLKDCVVATSGYTGAERIYLTHLAVSLGAMHQDSFAKRTNIEKKQYAGTHLICTLPMGNKYNAAVRWNLPAVTGEWLRACLNQLCRVDETPYLVGETMAPERPQDEPQSLTMGPPKSTPTRQIFTPKRQLTQTPGIDTPLINKRLNLSQQQNMANSPFHVATPNTPYGQIFKPNPSPDTRKAWAKWIDDIPDVKEPPAKQRRVSTPLTELKRRVWSAMRKPLDSSQLSESISQNQNLSNSQDNHHDLESDTDKPSHNIVPLEPKQLSFTEESSPTRKNQISEQLEQMNKVFQAATSNSESRFSLHGDNVKVFAEATDNINNYMPATQPESVGWEDPHPHISLKSFGGQTIHEETTSQLNHEHSNQTLTRKFMLSGLKERALYEKIIKELGGEVSTVGNFDITATHLLCLRPTRNEKMVGSIASGKWILHCSYVRECEKAGKFIDEDEFEWGNPRSIYASELDNEQERQLALAAHKWRIKLSGKNSGAFHDMVAMLMVSKEKYATFERLIKAGGGTVVEAKPPYNSPNGKKVTHCFIQMNQLEQPVDWAMLASKGILCYVPTYLNKFLTMDYSDPKDHVIPEFKKYFPLLPKELLK
ncbi:DNA topoisomerase 2-binding protein 1 isoform X2 [Chelonus insularis]|uniref:DNA topoisomerase 2-binding protein 1 isoform X2 n=1 Tax=Chelonus insularis TaxID=460826 RepID=UPI00158DEDA7|nr:DNA topoisomerase 2-binding protein 1 isoform X2 [Chelonus insularis]